MGRFYAVDIRTLSDPKYDLTMQKMMSEDRREKCLRYLREDDRKRCVGAWRIICRILQDSGISDNKLTYGINGKPEADGIFFNVSHSGNYVIGLFSDVPIGCDIELMTEPPLEIADAYFYCSERAYLNLAEDKKLAFFKLWTIKESYMKMTGEGMSLPLDSFEVRLNDNKTSLYRNGERQKCAFMCFDFDGHYVSLCEKKENVSFVSGFPENIRWLNG